MCLSTVSSSQDGFTPLGTAKTLELKVALLEHGANPIALDKDGLSPLFTAETPELVAALLKRGADPHSTDQVMQPPAGPRIAIRSNWRRPDLSPLTLTPTTLAGGDIFHRNLWPCFSLTHSPSTT